MPDIWVVDTGPLSHFAVTGYLDILRRLAPGGTITIPDLVVRELGQAPDPRVRAVRELPWATTRTVADDAEIETLAEYLARLDTADGRNVGECGVLALAETHGWVAIIDDSAAVALGRERDVQVHRTARLLCDGIRAELLTRIDGERIADALVASGYRLPFAPGEFLAWADDYGLL